MVDVWERNECNMFYLMIYDIRGVLVKDGIGSNMCI